MCAGSGLDLCRYRTSVCAGSGLDLCRYRMSVYAGSGLDLSRYRMLMCAGSGLDLSHVLRAVSVKTSLRTDPQLSLTRKSSWSVTSCNSPLTTIIISKPTRSVKHGHALGGNVGLRDVAVTHVNFDKDVFVLRNVSRDRPAFTSKSSSLLHSTRLRYLYYVSVYSVTHHTTM